MRPLQGQSIFIMVMVTLILATSFLNGIIAIIWGVNVYPLNIHGYRTSIPLFLGTHTDAIDITTVVGTIVVIGGIALFLRYARFGIEMRAAAESTLLASYSGVGVLWTATISWAVAFGTCALAGIATAARSPVDSSITDLGLYAFPAIILGGLDSVPGAIIGAYALAIVRGATAAYVPSGGLYTDVAAYIFMLVILMVRPYGLFGTREFRRL
jgi:branched-chain amino acid transport system permease protein